MSSVMSFSFTPVGPTAPESLPPCPAAIATRRTSRPAGPPPAARPGWRDDEIAARLGRRRRGGLGRARGGRAGGGRLERARGRLLGGVALALERAHRVADGAPRDEAREIE